MDVLFSRLRVAICRQLWVGVSGMLMLLGLNACVRVSRPDALMRQTKIELDRAREAGASDYDPVGWGCAQHKFQQAQHAMTQHHFHQAAMFAAESSMDARLALTHARFGAVRARIQDKVATNARLRQQNRQASVEYAQYQAHQQAQTASKQATGSTQAVSLDEGFQNVPPSTATSSTSHPDAVAAPAHGQVQP